MSLGARIAISLVALMGALGFLMTAADPSSLSVGAEVFYGLAFIFGVIAIACLFPKTHPFTLRIIGATVFMLYAEYVVDSFQTRNFERAFRGFWIYGLPSGYLAIAGQLPGWGIVSKVFQAIRIQKR